jgi:hypothetical protein
MLIDPQLQTALLNGAFALLGGVIGSLLTGWFLLRSKEKEYKNDFFKIVINKRVDGYEHLEAFIQAFKTMVLDTDNRPYHFPFSSHELHTESLILLGNAIDRGLWLSNNALEKVRELNRFQFQTPNEDSERIEFGKEHYEEIANIRATLETIVATDMLQLHKVEPFLSTKKTQQGLEDISAWKNVS